MKNGNIFFNRRCEQFLAIYETGKIHHAAEKLGISQPALTSSLKQLESSIGTILFERSVNGLKATTAADALYRYAVSLKLAGEYSLQEIDSLNAEQSGHIRIGAGVAWTTTLLPPILKQLAKKFPNLSIELITGVGDGLASMFAAGKLDVFLAAGSVELPESPNYSRDFLANLPMYAVADPNSELSKLHALKASDLAKARWIGFVEDESITPMANHYLAGSGVGPVQFAMRTNSITVLRSFLQGSEMVCVVVAPLARSIKRDGFKILDTADSLWTLPVNLYTWSISKTTSAVSMFNKLVKEEIKLYWE